VSTFGLELATDFTGARTPLNHWTCIDSSRLQHDVCTMLPDQRCVHVLGKCHRVVQHAQGVFTDTPRACFIACLGRVTPARLPKHGA